MGLVILHLPGEIKRTKPVRFLFFFLFKGGGGVVKRLRDNGGPKMQYIQYTNAI